MYYCYSIKKGLFDEEMEYAKALGIYLFYDEEKDLFFDKDGSIIDIRRKKIFPRTGALQADDLIKAILRHHGNSIAKENDYEKTLNWPKYVKTKRNNVIMTGRQILDNPERIIEMFGTNHVFFKTKAKNYSQTIPVETFLEDDSPFQMALEEHQDDDFIISDVVEIVEDQAGPLEYRAFVVEGKIFNISRIHDYLLGEIPEMVLEELQKMMARLQGTDFPESYVADFFIYKDGEGKTFVDVLECNPVVASGTYLYNTVFEKSDDLLHKNPNTSIPREKITYGPVTEYGFDVTSKPVPSILYKLPGGFAADLLSFSICGKKSSQDQIIHVKTSERLNPLETIESLNILDFISDMTFVESDSELGGTSLLGMKAVSNEKEAEQLRKTLLSDADLKDNS